MDHVVTVRINNSKKALSKMVCHVCTAMTGAGIPSSVPVFTEKGGPAILDT